MDLKKIAAEALSENHIEYMMSLADNAICEVVEDVDLVEERRRFEKCKECGKFKGKGRPCSHCPTKNKFIVARVAELEDSVGNDVNRWGDKTKERARESIAELLAEMHRSGKDGKGKGWRNRSVVLNNLTEEESREMKAANPNLRVHPGMEETIDIDQMVHAIKEHGLNAKHRQPHEVPLLEKDLLLIPEVLSDHVAIVPGLGRSDGKKQEGVELWKKVGEGVYLCIIVDYFDTKETAPKVKFQTMLKFERQPNESLA